MAEENRWGAPRIYSELLMLGFNDISEVTVSRRDNPNPSRIGHETADCREQVFLVSHRVDF